MAHAAHAGSGTNVRQTLAPLGIALGLTLAVVVLEIVGGLAAHSLALVADAAHAFMDALALGIALAAAYQARRPANARRSFGYARIEILAALGNAGMLGAIVVLIAIEAVRRLFAPVVPLGLVMTLIALAGFALNLIIGATLVRARHRDLNLRAALTHVASDAAGALAVALGGVAVALTHRAWIDPLLSLGVAALVVWGIVAIVREAADVLLESAPAHAQIPIVRARIESVAGVVGVHDLHVWSIGSGSHVLTAHVLLADARISEASAILRELERRLRSEFAIGHLTIQFECESCAEDDRIVCTQPEEA